MRSKIDPAKKCVRASFSIPGPLKDFILAKIQGTTMGWSDYWQELATQDRLKKLIRCKKVKA
jgi:hypothetical protein